MFAESPLSFGTGIQAIALPPQVYIVADGTDAQASGWGEYVLGEGLSEVLQVVVFIMKFDMNHMKNYMKLLSYVPVI